MGIGGLCLTRFIWLMTEEIRPVMERERNVASTRARARKPRYKKGKAEHDAVAFLDHGSGGKNGHHKPLGFADTVKSGVYLLIQKCALHKIVGGHERILDDIIVQPVNAGQGGIRGGDKIVALIDNIGNASCGRKILGQDFLKRICGIVKQPRRHHRASGGNTWWWSGYKPDCRSFPVPVFQDKKEDSTAQRACFAPGKCRTSKCRVWRK